MWGAIIGDLAGSIYEYNQSKKITKIDIKDKLLTEQSFYSDDTILTIAILEALLENQNYEIYLKKYIQEYQEYKPNFSPYFKTAFSPGIIKWANQNITGISIGNGAMMRISPIGYLFNSEKEIIKNAKLATIPSHNSKEAIDSATLISLIIFWARKKLKKKEIITKLNLDIKYTPFSKFNTTCHETLDNCLYALFTTNSFKDSLKEVISYGGDTDTNACIVGAMAEALYGIDAQLIKQAETKVPPHFTKVLNRGYSQIKYNI